MKHDATDVKNYNFTAEDELFLDTNVWFLIYGLQKPCDSRVSVYSSVFRRILDAQSRIYIDVLIVSEFINVYSRKRSKIDPNVKFKTFRNSLDFKTIAQETADSIKRVLAHCFCVESRFEMLDVESLIGEYARGGADFNDLVIKELCKSRGLKLITDDGDFDGQGIPVLTANKRLLG